MVGVVLGRCHTAVSVCTPVRHPVNLCLCRAYGRVLGEKSSLFGGVEVLPGASVKRSRASHFTAAGERL